MSFNSIWLYKYLCGWVGGIQLAHCSRYLIRFGLLGICIPLDVFFYTEFSPTLSPGAMKLQEKFRMNSFGSRLSSPLAQCIVRQMRGFPFCSCQELPEYVNPWWIFVLSILLLLRTHVKAWKVAKTSLSNRFSEWICLFHVTDVRFCLLSQFQPFIFGVCFVYKQVLIVLKRGDNEQPRWRCQEFGATESDSFCRKLPSIIPVVNSLICYLLRGEHWNCATFVREN